MLSKEHFVKVIQENQGIINCLCRIYFTSEEDRKDARQDIILQLWQAFPEFRQDAKVSTWLYRVALNTILNKTRKEKWRSVTDPLDDLETNQLPAISFADDDAQQLQQAINLLSDTDKALVILHLEGYNHKEIAATLTTTETNISTRFNRIKTKLQKIYRTLPYVFK